VTSAIGFYEDCIFKRH